jgi:hypothetical protein
MQHRTGGAFDTVFTDLPRPFYEVLMSGNLFCASEKLAQEQIMGVVMDLVFVGLIFAFFAATVGLVRFCANVLGDKGGRSS